MTKQAVLLELEKLGTAQNRKVYARHGISGASFGVSFANLGKLKKQIKLDHDLAEGLWATGNHDARVLATMIADPARMTAQTLAAWSRELDNYVLTDALSSLAARSAAAPQLLAKWTASGNEWVGAAGWNLLACLLRDHSKVSDGDLEDFVSRIESGIHAAKNRTRYSMNNALIAIGTHNAALEKKALAAAKRIGKVEVDHGETGCKTPDAAAYIKKTVEYRRQKQKARA